MIKNKKKLKIVLFDKIKLVLNYGHSIPITNKTTKVDFFGDCSNEIIKKEQQKYYKGLLCVEEEDFTYNLTRINKKEIDEILRNKIKIMSIEELNEELEHYNDCLELYNEEKNKLIF